jgi:glycosyltransferase involved in cell wall biosynthesis
MAKPRILYVEMAHSVGGSVISLYHLLRGLDRRCYEPVVLFYWDNAYVSRFRELGIETIVWAGPRKKGDAISPGVKNPVLPAGLSGRAGAWERRYLWIGKLYHGLGLAARTFFQTLPLAWRIRRIVRAKKIDLLHANDLVNCNREVIMAARLTGRPCICHIRAFEHYTALDRFLAQFVDRFVFISEAIAADCIAQGAEATRGTVIYNALELADYLQAFDDGSARERLGLRPEDRVVGIIGRLVPWKGQDVFIRAMAQAAKSIPNLQCLIIGDVDAGEERGYRVELERLAQQVGLGERVKFLGWRSDIPQLLSTMEILVHASVEPEPFGRVLIEGMAASKVVIAAAAGACPEIIEDGVSGYLVAPGDAEALARATVAALQDPDRLKAMGMVARHQVEIRFSIEEHVRQVQQVYAALLPAGDSDA